MMLFNFKNHTRQLMLIITIVLSSFQGFCQADSTWHAMMAPGTLSENSVTLLWDKQEGIKNAVYDILLNDKFLGSTTKTNYTAEHLIPDTWYTLKINAKGLSKTDVNTSNSIRFKTPAKGKTFNILDYGAKADGLTKNTKAIQAAIDACTEGGRVVIPKGTFVSGALYLKSNMTLSIEAGGILKGSSAVEDYLPMILNRFEGWELKTYASLLNAGTLNRDGTYNVTKLQVTGNGTIMGGGQKLGDAMVKASGIRSRGRLICFMNCQDVCLSNLTVTEPPSWTIHYIYSNAITCHDLNIITYGIANGDGIDPDSSTDSYIFNCRFDNGDDCIAIKSGKNPEGFLVGKPTKNVRITHCDFKRGHGISIGSEMSGGVSDVFVQDCKAGNLINGMQIKGTKERGGYVKNVTVVDCQLLKITVFSALNYNNDGDAAPEIPTFENFVFKNIDMSMAPAASLVIDINGFKDPAHPLRDVQFTNIQLPENSTVKVNDADKINFINVTSASGTKPNYTVSNSTHVVY